MIVLKPRLLTGQIQGQALQQCSQQDMGLKLPAVRAAASSKFLFVNVHGLSGDPLHEEAEDW